MKTVVALVFTFSVCTNAVVRVQAMQQAAPGDRPTCTVTSTSPCFPYSCDSQGKMCDQSCLSDNNCATGAVCSAVTSQCTVLTYQCTDTFTITASSGYTSSCMPYKCVAGSCQQQCSMPGDCYTGWSCVGGHCTK